MLIGPDQTENVHHIYLDLPDGAKREYANDGAVEVEKAARRQCLASPGISSLAVGAENSLPDLAPFLAI